MSKHPKARSDLQFQKSNLPKPIEIDYSRDVADADFKSVENSMLEKFGSDAQALKAALVGGILISGEPW